MSILINKAVYGILSGSTELATIVGTKIFPIVANESTSFPFVVYKRISVEPSYSKDGPVEDLNTITIIAVSDNYSQGIDIAEIIRTELENKTGTFNEVKIIDSKVDNIDEDYIENTFIQSVTFKIRTIK